jgi:diguanylate cyclase (GGDEF)-like protein
MKILLVEDDEPLAQIVTSVLAEQNYQVDIATDGLEGYELAAAFAYDLVILDVMLPKLDGIRFCRRLRSHNNPVPILLLTARDTSTDKQVGLDAGADDYVVKPFDVQELAARVRALLRRGSTAAAPILSWGALQLDPSQREVTYAAQLLNLTRKEYALLELFLRNKGRVFSRSAILNQLWSFEEPPGEETVKAHIKGLRHKLKAVGAEDLIETLYGQGYRLNLSDCGESAPKPIATASQPSQQATQTLIATIWTKTRATTFDRLLMLEKAATALSQGCLDRDLRQKAEQAAHKLLGTLGSFGIQEGSDLARQLESLFEGSNPLKQSEILQVQQLVAALRQVLEAVPHASPQQVSQPQVQPAPVSDNAVLPQPLQPDRPTIVKIMAVDDDRLMLLMLKTVLEPWGVQLTSLQNPQQFWQTLATVQPDLLILDVELPEISGLELCQAVRNSPQWSWLPILFLSAHSQASVVHRVFEAGADDYVTKPIVPPELISRIFNRLERTRLLRSMAETDLLTGLLNRQRSTQDLEQFLQLARHAQQPVCLAVIDIDQLQQINRCWGHDIGDRVLRQTAQLLKQKLRQEDVIARWSGSEFIVGSYGISQTDGVEWLAEILETLRSTAFTTPAGEGFSVSFSAGVAQYPTDGTHLQMLYRTAEAALHQAKQAGGDRVLPVGWQPLAEAANTVDVALIHSDEKFAAQVIKALETRGYHTRWLPTTTTALATLSDANSALPASLILLGSDADCDRLQLLKRLKAKPLRRTVKNSGSSRESRPRILLLLTQASEAEKALQSGASDYILLPCRIPALMQRIRNVMGEKHE